MNYTTSPAFTLARSQKKSKIITSQIYIKCPNKITRALDLFTILGEWGKNKKIAAIQLVTQKEHKSITGLNRLHPLVSMRPKI